jgi:hypothetical protein
MWTGPVVVGVLLSIFWLVSSTQELDVALPPPPPPVRARGSTPLTATTTATPST